MKPRKNWRTWRDDYITRVMAYSYSNDKVSVRGYDVRFKHRNPQHYFAVKRYGSERAALKAARACRDELVKAAGEPPRRRGRTGRRVAPFLVTPRGDNKSGIVGVTTTGAHWIAWYHPRPGKQKRRSWSIKKYGDEGALILASQWREKMIKGMR